MASKFDELDLLFGTRLLLLSSTSLKLFPGDVPVYGTSAEITMKNILNREKECCCLSFDKSLYPFKHSFPIPLLCKL